MTINLIIIDLLTLRSGLLNNFVSQRNVCAIFFMFSKKFLRRFNFFNRKIPYKSISLAFFLFFLGTLCLWFGISLKLGVIYPEVCFFFISQRIFLTNLRIKVKWQSCSFSSCWKSFIYSWYLSHLYNLLLSKRFPWLLVGVSSILSRMKRFNF